VTTRFRTKPNANFPLQQIYRAEKEKNCQSKGENFDFPSKRKRKKGENEKTKHFRIEKSCYCAIVRVISIAIAIDHRKAIRLLQDNRRMFKDVLRSKSTQSVKQGLV
jgi:hypothetical protein